MESLPDELLSMIFERLTSRERWAGPARVCHRWATLCGSLALRVRSATDARRLSVHAEDSTPTFVTPYGLFAAALGACLHLRELTVHAALPLSDTQLDALARLPYLRHLDVFATARVLDKRLAPVAARLDALVVNESVAPGFLRELATGRLRELHMFGRALYYPRSELLAVLRVRRDSLTELTLRCTELTDATYEAIGACERLTSLQLYSCWLMKGESASLVTRPRGLRRLHLTGTFMVRRSALCEMLAQLPPRLEELVLSSSCLGDEHVSTLIGRVPALHTLEAWRCRLSAAGAVTLAAALPALRELDLDLQLDEQQLRLLRMHPALERLRYQPRRGPQMRETVEEAREWNAIESCAAGARRPLHVEAADTRYANKWFRGGGEGFRANLFYYWAQDETLVPLHSDAQPAFYHDDDDDAYY